MSCKRILGQNMKMKKTMKIHSGYRIFNVSMPIDKTCIWAGICRKGCYAHYGRQFMAPALNSQRENYQMWEDGTFFTQLGEELERERRIALKKGQRVMIRIHDVGDFFSMKYLSDWCDFIDANPDVEFYAYTKSVALFKTMEQQRTMPENFTYVFSYGGRQDMMIDPNHDRYSVVVPRDSTVPEGYTDGSDDDYFASRKEVRRIALRFHGQGKEFLSGPTVIAIDN